MALKFAFLPSGDNSFDPVSRQLGEPGTNPQAGIVTPFGPAINFPKTAASRLSYSGAAAFDGVDGPATFVALVRLTEGSTPDTANDNIMGFATADTASFYLRTNATPVARMTVAGKDANITSPPKGVWLLWVGRYEGPASDTKQIDLFNMDGSLYATATDSTAPSTGSLPAAGTPLTLGEITGSGLGGADFDVAVAYYWNEWITDEQETQLARDPFGPLRMDLSGPEVWAAVGVAFTLDPDGDGTISNIRNESGGTTNLYLSVDDDPDTPVTTDWVTSDQTDGSVFFTLTASPPDFDPSSITGLTFRADVGSMHFASDTATLYAQIFAANETTNYTDEISVATQASTGLVTAEFTVNATGLAASKADWDGARVKVRWDYTA